MFHWIIVQDYKSSYEPNFFFKNIVRMYLLVSLFLIMVNVFLIYICLPKFCILTLWKKYTTTVGKIVSCVKGQNKQCENNTSYSIWIMNQIYWCKLHMRTCTTIIIEIMQDKKNNLQKFKIHLSMIRQHRMPRQYHTTYTIPIKMEML